MSKNRKRRYWLKWQRYDARNLKVCWGWDKAPAGQALNVKVTNGQIIAFWGHSRRPWYP